MSFIELTSAVMSPFTIRSVSTVPVSVPSITIPTPAAAPPVPILIPVARKGRLKVLGPDGRFRGYLADRIQDGKYRFLTETPGLALSVLIPPRSSDHPFEIQPASQVAQTKDAVGVTWANVPAPRWMENSSFVAICCSWSTVKSTTTWATERAVWRLSDDSELSVRYPKPDGGFEPLQAHLSSKGGPVLWFKYSRPFAFDYDKVRVLFEQAE
ncbi:hypothetical protein FRC01_002322 [Tulasnella sp. 417]|nr:hypothetical protein FRC01_002322 [Tulasnella sp. 417]